MVNYIIKRILIMIPTFFVISCVIFVILNLAPGRPTPTMGDTEGRMDPSELLKGQEAYKYFNEQFHLDKPILFNTRFALSKEEVLEAIKFMASCGDLNSPLRKDPAYFKKVTRAQENLLDWGLDAVPQLIDILNESKDLNIQYTVLGWLGTNAQLPLKEEEFVEENRKIDLENSKMRQLTDSITISSGNSISPEKIAKAKKEWNAWYARHKNIFQRSFWDKFVMFFTETRFGYYWSNLLHLDFGISHTDKKKVFPKVIGRIPYSASILFAGILLAYLIAVPIGIFSAVKRGSKIDAVVTVILFMLYALPSFFTATLALKYFGGEGAGLIYLFPTGNFHNPNPEIYYNWPPHQRLLDIGWHLILPITMIMYGYLAALSRYARSGLLEVVNSDYIRTARAKGLSEKVVILRHAVRNGMIPILTLLATLLPLAVSGSIVIEYIFNIPGIGALMLDAIQNREYNTIMCISLMASALTLIGILLSDISYALVDPRITYK